MKNPLKNTVFLIVLAAALASCADLVRGDEGSVVIRLPGDSAARAVPGAETLAALEYRLTLTGGGETIHRTVSVGQSRVVISVAAGVWNIQAEASIPAGTLYNDDTLAKPVHVGTGSARVTVAPGKTASATIQMVFDNTTPKSVTVNNEGDLYTAKYAGNGLYTVILRNYHPQPANVSITVNKAVDDQDILVDGVIITDPITITKTLPELGFTARGQNTADLGTSPTFTVSAGTGYSTTYTVKLISGWIVNTETSPRDLKTRILTVGAEVTVTFNALHWLINTPEAGNFADIIQLGDWIDLPSLTVARYHTGTEAPDGTDSGTDTDAENGAINVTNTTWDGDHGELLRLVVVGKNSFNGINGNTDPHVVFQFQNAPGTHRMNAEDTNVGGYAASEMRKYLTPTGDAGSGNFYSGLQAAGVPDGVVWAPSRRVWNGYGSTTVDTIEDKLWLPTEWEMFGSNTNSNGSYEGAVNQASFTGYYTNANSRIKYNDSNMSMWYCEASPSSTSAAYFCYVYTNGSAGNTNASTVGGVAPAFCVK